MSRRTKIAAALAVMITAVINLPDTASARSRLYPLTRCGPELAYLCPIHGYFDQTPFRYEMAVYPGCIRTAPVETPQGLRNQKVIVCGAPPRQMIRW